MGGLDFTGFFYINVTAFKSVMWLSLKNGNS